MSILLCAFNKSIADELTDRLDRQDFPDLDWSDEQRPILSWFQMPAEDDPRSLIVIARAGTGKTTTIMGAVNGALESDEITAKTLHSLGFSIVRRWWESVRIGRDRPFNLARKAAKGAPDQVVKLVAKLHTKGREMVPLAQSGAELEDLAVQFECEPGEGWAEYGWTLQTVCSAAHRAMELAEERPDDGEIDFTDMIYLPVRLGWARPMFDLVVVDEAQDMNACQILLARGVCRDRFVAVGDDRQAVYSFRGADSTVLHRLTDEMSARVLTLTTTYRCARSIVAVASEYVPDFKAGASNPEGLVDELYQHKVLDHVQPGDAVLSRINAPLIALALKALRQGIPAMVAGKDVAAGLRALIKKLATGRAKASVPAFLEKLTGWQERETERARLLPKRLIASKVDRIWDQAEALRALADGVGSISEIHARLENLFSAIDRGEAIHFSSVHRAKGLEWPKVFVLASTLRTDNTEEENICYVAVTRAQKHLVLVI